VWAQARRLVERGDAAGAVELLAARFADEQQADARDPAGRLIAPLAGLRALELVADPEAPRYTGLRDALAARLNDYSPPLMAPPQRRFLMHRLLEMRGRDPEFPTLDAEELAADYLAAEPDVPETTGLTPSGLPGVWRMAPESRRAVGLFQQRRFLEDMHALLREAGAMPGAAVELRRPDERSGDEDAFLAGPVGDLLPGWRLALMLEGPDPFSEAAEKQVAAYLWTSLLGIGTIVAAALVGGHVLLRQAKLTRLKNDFIATVTHELKTPLAAVRMFAETLREERYQDREQARRYLDLLVSENERLSRLIDNFLSFSRMERDRRAFDSTEVVPEDIVQEVAEVVRERFHSDECSFEVAVEPGLPRVMADPDALTTVLLNLLDNAYKYTGEDKRITLRARATDGQVCFEVEDNGIGMSRREAGKAFDRFYQADSRLSRRATGCGLGLSIVKFIVDAHGGTIDVRSQPGEGSTFTVRLPAAQAGEES
jgi:signal transduction histidine kinase